MLLPQESDIDPTLLSSTNLTWNQTGINHPWSVGFTSELIRQYEFEEFDEWRTHYLESGVIRDERLQEFSTAEIDILEDHRWYSNASASQKEDLGQTLIDINFFRGRSPRSLFEKAERFIDALRNMAITEHEAAKLIGHRVLTETWNGHVRETNAIVNLEKEYPDYTFLPSSGWEDLHYAIDYSVLLQDELITGLQIKPESYKGNSEYIKAATASNNRKNQKYSKKHNVPVVTLLSSIDGKMENFQEIRKILSTGV